MAGEGAGSTPDRTRLALRLDGPVSLDVFEEAVHTFRQLVGTLTDTYAGGRVRWVIDYLEAGSAEVGVRGEAESQDDVALVTEAWGSLGEAAEAADVSAFDIAIQREFTDLTTLLAGQVESLRMTTAAGAEAFVEAPMPDLPPPTVGPTALFSYGAVTGRIETLAHRQMKFSLYDLLDDKRVDCWLASGQEDLVKDAWGQLAIVQGRVRREPRHGRIISVREITDVKPFADPESGGWRASQGIISVPDGTEMPEDTIRRLRDDE